MIQASPIWVHFSYPVSSASSTSNRSVQRKAITFKFSSIRSLPSKTCSSSTSIIASSSSSFLKGSSSNGIFLNSQRKCLIRKMRKKKGVTISAAFEKFTERAIKAILFSQKEAQEHGKEVVLTQHLLLGLIAEEENSPDGFLSSGVTIEKAREAVRSIWDLRIPSFAPNDNNNTKVGDGDDKNDVTYHHVPFSIEVKRVFEAAAEYSKLLGYNFIGPEHLLVALFKVDDKNAGIVLKRYFINIHLYLYMYIDCICYNSRGFFLSCFLCLVLLLKEAKW